MTVGSGEVVTGHFPGFIEHWGVSEARGEQLRGLGFRQQKREYEKKWEEQIRQKKKEQKISVDSNPRPLAPYKTSSEKTVP